LLRKSCYFLLEGALPRELSCIIEQMPLKEQIFRMRSGKSPAGGWGALLKYTVMGHALGCRRMVEWGLNTFKLAKNPIPGSRSQCLWQLWIPVTLVSKNLTEQGSKVLDT